MLEGGPTLNGECFRAGVVDELFLTLGGVVVGGHGLPTAVEMPAVTASRETVHAPRTARRRAEPRDRRGLPALPRPTLAVVPT